MIWNDKFELSDGSFSISLTQDYFGYNIEKHETFADDNPPLKIYIDKIRNKIPFKEKSGYYLELLTSETMKLLGSTKNKITKDKIGETAPHLEIQVHSIIVNNDYQ